MITLHLKSQEVSWSMGTTHTHCSISVGVALLEPAVGAVRMPRKLTAYRRRNPL